MMYGKAPNRTEDKQMNTKIKVCLIFSLLSVSPGCQSDSSQPIDKQGPL